MTISHVNHSMPLVEHEIEHYQVKPIFERHFGCLDTASPLFDDFYSSNQSNSNLSLSVTLKPFHFSRSVIRCLSQEDLIALQKYGYQNCFCDLSGSFSELTFDCLHNVGVEVIVYFSDTFGTDFDMNRATELSNYYNVHLCEVKLPFALKNLSSWDIYQWQLFDKRLSSALKNVGAYNERYQA